METFTYRKKPIVIEAVQLKEDTNTQNNSRWFQDAIDNDNLTLWCAGGKVVFAKIYTPEGEMTAKLGDYIIKGVNGELYPCKPDIFEKTYEKVSE